jgi:hypothetical protein
VEEALWMTCLHLESSLVSRKKEEEIVQELKDAAKEKKHFKIN